VTARRPTGTDPHPIVQFMLSEPGIIERLLAEHVDDGTGHCRVCTAGPQAGRQKFPCRLREFAEQARDAMPDES
jgi:hypothetical protein